MKRCIFLTVAIFAGLGLTNRLQASCGAATCPLNTHHYLEKGQLQLTLAYEYINQNQIYVGSNRSHIGALPNPHDEIQTINERKLLQLQCGLTKSLAFNMELPFIHRQHSHIEAGTVETFNFDGIGDLTAAAEYLLPFSSSETAPKVGILAGAKFHTGVTDATNMAGAETAEVTIQPGTGSTDAIFGINISQPLVTVKTLSGGLYSRMPLAASVTFRRNGKGIEDYRFGNTWLAHVGTEYRMLERASLLFQVNGRFQGYADVGTTGEERTNTGGTWIYLSPGFRTNFSDAFSAYTFAQFPVYQNVHGIQQTAKLNLQFGLSANMRLWK